MRMIGLKISILPDEMTKMIKSIDKNNTGSISKQDWLD